MKHFLFYSSLLMGGIFLSSCSSEEIFSNKGNIKRIEASISNFQMEDGELQTRTSYTFGASGYEAVWATGDVLGIYPLGGDQVAFPISDGVGTTRAVFDGGAWALRGTYKYAAYYPFSQDNYTISETEIPVTYIGQIQNSNNATTHLAKYDYMAAAATQPSSDGSVILPFKHLSSYLTLPLTLPKAGTYTKLTLSSSSGSFITKGTVDLSASNPVITATETSSSISMDLNNIVLTEDNLVLTANMLIAPVNLTGSTISITVTDSNGASYTNKEKAWTRSAAFLANTTYKASRTLSGSGTGGEIEGGGGLEEDDDIAPYITFKSESTQTLKMSIAVPTLEYSVNDGAWAELGVNTVTFGGSNGDLRLRGKSSSGTAGSQILFGKSEKVSCQGDIRTLVNYDNYESADCRAARFQGLFQNCYSLSSAPELPATDLASYCYNAMFRGCTSLTVAPELPATTLSNNCYEEMFNGCSSLTVAPDLPAITLSDDCYKGMFSSCSSLTTAPKLPAKDLARSCYHRLFEQCTALSEAPELPATILAPACYCKMFISCSSLTTAPELPATELATECYGSMFGACTSLKVAPELSATTLVDHCYFCMFDYCTALTTAPELPAKELAPYCYYGMFSRCLNLNKISMNAVDISAQKSLTDWVSGVSTTGVFVKNSHATWDNEGIIPSGWTVITEGPNMHYGHEYVDLGLPSGLLWATCNIGAVNPEDYGDYYSWGEIEPYYIEGHAQDSPCSDWKVGTTGYDWASYKWCKERGSILTKYCNDSSYGIVDNKIILDLEDDAAHANWGGRWRMPTQAEQDELMDASNCILTWTTQNDMMGYKVTSKKNNNSIFLPAAGFYVGFGLYSADSNGLYWSSSLDTSTPCWAYHVNFNASIMDYRVSARGVGLSVRSVCVLK